MRKIQKFAAVILALVMLVSAIGPVKVSAAELPKLNVASKTLYVGGSTVKSSLKQTYTLKLKNKPAKYAIAWKSSDEDIVKVTKLKAGKATIEAVDIGKATVTATVKDKVNNKWYSFDVIVTVKKNCAAVAVSPSSVARLEIGDTIQLTGTMYNANATKAVKGVDVTDYMHWVSDDKSVATVDDNGLVTAVGGGSTVVTCYTVQDETGTYSTLAKATAKKSIEINVKGDGLDSVVQKSLNSITAVFSNDMSQLVTKNNIFLKSGSSVLGIASIEFDATGRAATIVAENEFIEDKVYSLTYGEDTATFTATKGTPASLAIYTPIDNNKAVAGNITELKFRIYNRFGVDITPLNTNSAEYLTYASAISYSAASEGSWFVSNGSIFFNSPGSAVNVIATYRSYVTVDGVLRENVITSNLLVTSVTEASTMTLDKVIITNSAESGEQLDWTGTNNAISLSDSGYRLVARIKNHKGEYIYSDTPGSAISFEAPASSNTLAVFSSGDIFPFAVGAETVTVYYGADVIGGYPVQVKEARRASAIVFELGGKNVNSITLSSKSGMGMLNLNMTVYDQMGDVIKIPVTDTYNLVTGVTVEKSSSTSAPSVSVYGGKNGSAVITLNASGYGSSTGKTYQYKVTYKDSVYGSVTSYFTIAVYDPNTKLASTYELEITGDTDLAIATASSAFPTLNLELYEMKGNVKYSRITNLRPETSTTTSGSYFYAVYDEDGVRVNTGNSTGSISLVSVLGSELIKYEPGTYTVKVFNKVNNNAVYLAEKTFTLTDTKSEAKVVQKSTTTIKPITVAMTQEEMKAVFMDCFTVSIGETIVSSANIELVNPVTANGQMIIRDIIVKDYVTIGSTAYYIKYTVTVNKQIRN